MQFELDKLVTTYENNLLYIIYWMLCYKIENDRIKSRIMPTKSLPPHSKPWLVALFRKHIKKFTCTGSLIGKTSVLTAAHCCIVQKAALGAHCYDEIDLEEMISIRRFKTFMFEDGELAKYSPISRNACKFDLDVGIAATGISIDVGGDGDVCWQGKHFCIP